jgi:hypothetical protein
VPWLFAPAKTSKREKRQHFTVCVSWEKKSGSHGVLSDAVRARLAVYCDSPAGEVKPPRDQTLLDDCDPLAEMIVVSQVAG